MGRGGPMGCMGPTGSQRGSMSRWCPPRGSMIIPPPPMRPKGSRSLPPRGGAGRPPQSGIPGSTPGRAPRLVKKIGTNFMYPSGTVNRYLPSITVL